MGPFYIPEFNENGVFSWNHNEFDNILTRYGFSTEKHDVEVMLANGVMYSLYDNLYWKEAARH